MFVVDSPFVVCCFFPFCCVLRLFHTNWKGRTRRRMRHTPGSSHPPRARVRARGAPSCAAVWTRPFGIFFSLLCVWQRVRGAPGTIFGGEGAYIAPSGPFFTRTFVFPMPQVFFLSVSFFFCWSLGPPVG